MSELVKRLRESKFCDSRTSFQMAHEAADALEVQAKRIAELEAGLADAIEAQQIIGMKMIESDSKLIAAEAKLVAAGKLRDAAMDYAIATTDGYKLNLLTAIAAFDKETKPESHSSTALGGPTPVTDSAPACERKE